MYGKQRDLFEKYNNQGKKNHKKRCFLLEKKAREIKIDVIKMCYEVGPKRKAHPGGALSAADIVVTLYFDIMRIDPSNPDWKERDRFILSKGHACPVLYAALANLGYFDKKQYKSLRRVGGMLQGHPDMRKIPGVDMTTGSLGNGLSAGIGMALSARMDKKNYRVFVLLGDGECDEGIVWEGAMAASKYKLDNLIAIVDMNGLQSCGTVKSIMPTDSLIDKWRSFGWNTIEINGHNMSEIIFGLELASSYTSKPSVIIAHTVKGKGVSFMENDNAWHQKTFSIEQYDQAVMEIEGAKQNV